MAAISATGTRVETMPFHINRSAGRRHIEGVRLVIRGSLNSPLNETGLLSSLSRAPPELLASAIFATVGISSHSCLSRVSKLQKPSEVCEVTSGAGTALCASKACRTEK
jgi:hypothetical protein